MVNYRCLLVGVEFRAQVYISDIFVQAPVSFCVSLRVRLPTSRDIVKHRERRLQLQRSFINPV